MPRPTPYLTRPRQQILWRWDNARPVLLAGLVGLVAGALACALRAALGPLFTTFGKLSGYMPPTPPGDGGLLMSFTFGEGGGGHLGGAALLLVLPALGALYMWLTPADKGDAFNQLVWQGVHKHAEAPQLRSEAAALGAGALGYAGGLLVGRDSAFTALGALAARTVGWGVHLSNSERHTLTLAGAAAALGAVLHAPLAAAVLVAEVLYRRFEFEYEILISCVLAAVLGYALYGSLYGFVPLFGVLPASLPLASVAGWLGAALVTLAVTLAAIAALWAGNRLREWAMTRPPEQAPSLMHPYVRLLAGATYGALTAVLVLSLSPAVLGGGEGWLGLGLLGLLGEDTAAVAGARWLLLALGLPLFFGAGVLPSAALGGLLGVSLNLWLGPITGLETSTAALLGATAFVTVSLNTPVAAALLAVAWGGENMLPAALLAAGGAHWLSGERGLLPAQVSSRVSEPRGTQAGESHGVPRVQAQAEARGPLTRRGSRRLYVRPVPSSWQGLPLSRLHLPPSTEVIAVQRGEETLMPRRSLRLQAGDTVHLLARPDAYAALEAWLELPELR